MKKIFFIILFLLILLSGGEAISQNETSSVFLPNGLTLNTYYSSSHFYKNFLIIYRFEDASSSKLVDIETGNVAIEPNFSFGEPFANKNICLINTNEYLKIHVESNKVFFGNRNTYFLDKKGSYLYSKVISERFKGDVLNHEYLHKIVVCPYNAKSWTIEQYSRNDSLYYNNFIIINNMLFSLFQYKKLEVYNSLDGSLIMSIDDFEDNLCFFEQNKDYLFLGKHLFHLNPLKVIAKIDQKGEWARVRLEDDRLIVCSSIDNRYHIAIYDLEGKLESIKALDVFHKNKYPDSDNQYFKMCMGIGKNCIVINNEKDATFEIWSIDNKLLDVIKINWSNGDRFAGIDMVIGDKLIIPLRTAIICYDTETLKVIWIKPKASRINVVDNRWISYFERTSIDSDTSAVLMDILNQDRKISIPSKMVSNFWLYYNNDILMFDNKFEKNTKWPAKVTQNGMEYPYKVQYSGETIYPFKLNNSLFCVYLDTNLVSKKLKLLSLNGNSWRIAASYTAEMEFCTKDDDKFALLTKDNYINLYLMADEKSPYNININKDYVGSFKIDSIYSKLFFWKSKYIVAYSKNTVDVFDFTGESIYKSDKNEFLGQDDNYLFFCNTKSFIVFDGTKETITMNPFGYLKNDDCQFVRNAKMYTEGQCIDLLTGEFYQHIFLTELVRLKEKWKIINSGDDFYVWNSDYWYNPSPIKYSPCNTYSIKKQIIGDKIELTIKNTSNKNLENPLSGTVRIMPYGADGKVPIFHEFDKNTFNIPSLKSGESATVEVPLPDMKILDNKLNMTNTDYFALIIESNGLLDTKNSELSDFDKEGRPLFDGVPTSLEKQQAIVVTVWKK